MKVDRPNTIRLERMAPKLEGKGSERGLSFDNGRFRVSAHELNGRGHPTGRMIHIASFAVPELAQKCRDRINAQNSSFQAQVEVDERAADQDVIENIRLRAWEGATPIQEGPYSVWASYLDQYGRYSGGGLVSYFKDRASAEICANTLNEENPAHEAIVENNDEARY